MAMSISNFCKLFTLGDKPTHPLLDGPIEITEKIDGSQFSFGRLDGVVHMRSKGAMIYEGNVPNLFKPVVKWVNSIAHMLPEGVIFHGETLASKRHNTLSYGRVPTNHFMLFGITDLGGLSEPEYDTSYLRAAGKHAMLQHWAGSLGCEAVPCLYFGLADPTMSLADFRTQLNERYIGKESVLGGAAMEGVVIKNYTQITVFLDRQFPMLCAKLVSAEFKEKHVEGWKQSNPTALDQIGQAFNATPRWEKAIQYFRDTGTLTATVKDIGPLIGHISKDILEEETDNIKDMLFKLFWKDIQRMAVRGFAEYYKDRLASGDLHDLT